MIVFTVVFGKLAKLPSDNVPYPILVFAALLPWQFFSNAVSEAGNSLVGNASMISKVYFPRLVIPASSRSEEHTSELQSLMRISYAVFCLKKKKKKLNTNKHTSIRKN